MSTQSEGAVRRRLAQVRRSFPPPAADGAASYSLLGLMTAIRRTAFLRLLEQSDVREPRRPTLEEALAGSLAEGQDRFYNGVVIPRCTELLGQTESSAECLPDSCFRGWMELFRTWEWSAVDGLGTQRATPGLLGALCETSLDQKTRGVYYTSADVTSYICANTLLPSLVSLLDTSATTPPILYVLSGWRLPVSAERYIRASAREPGFLPLETVQERAARRSQLERCRKAWNAGEIRTADDWITWNLDLGRLLEDWLLDTKDTAALARFHGALQDIRILDPTCGSGAFLIGALETLLPLHLVCRDRLPKLQQAVGHSSAPATDAAIVAEIVERNLYGVDLAPEAVETCRMRLLLRVVAARGCDLATLGSARMNVRQADVLAEAVFPEVMCGKGGFDAVVGNPPYVAYSAGGRYAGNQYRTEGSANLYALVTERALQLMRAGGRLGVILPVSSTSLPGFRPLAELLQQGNAWVSSYSNRPAKLFPGVEQRLSIWITGPSEEPTFCAAPYQHWYGEERPHLFSRLSYVRASIWTGTGMPIKSGCELAERLFRKIVAHTGRLVAFEEAVGANSLGGEAVWLHDGPTYWVRALAFEPNPDAPQEASHYHRIRVANAPRAAILAAILSSTTFYFFFKMISNCRDLGRKEWTTFPLNPLASAHRSELQALGGELQARLRETSRVRSRRYPCGVVEYREYYPASAKATLDAIDRALAGHYGFSDAELEYLLNYDLKYRMGQNDAG